MKFSIILFLLSFLFLGDAPPTLGQSPTPNADFDSSGEVDARDLLILLRQWSPSTGPSIEMVTLPPGSLLMGNSGSERDQSCFCNGCDCEEPRHPVTINYAFQMGKYEVTNAQYAEVLNWAKGRGYLRNSISQPYNGGDVYHNARFLFAIVDGTEWWQQAYIAYNGSSFFVESRNAETQVNHPVGRVTWYGAVAFCNWLSEREGRAPAYKLSTWSLTNRQGGGYRLPSESEWEYACRGSASNPHRYAPFSFGDDTNLDLYSCNFSSILDDYMVWCGNDDGWSEAVGSRLRNDYLLHDMHGNVWEWCQDTWHDSYSGTGRPDDGRPWESLTRSYGLLRGGAWYYDAGNCRSATRASLGPSRRGSDHGFRFARTVAP